MTDARKTGEKAAFRTEPTAEGFRCVSQTPDDPERRSVCALYPSHDPAELFPPEGRERMARYPLAPSVIASIAPRYALDLQRIAGAAGYGRFALCVAGESFFADTAEELDAEYLSGGMRYTLRDPRLGAGSLCIRLLPTAGAAGLCFSVTRQGLPAGTEVFFLHGGMLGWNLRSLFAMPYGAHMCAGNRLCLTPEGGTLSLPGAGTEPDGVRELSGKAWELIPGWERRLLIKTPGAEVFAAPPTAMERFVPAELSRAETAEDALFVARLPERESYYFALGVGKSIENAPPEALLAASEARLAALAEGLSVQTDDDLLNAAVRMASYPTHALFGGNVFLHGLVSWRCGYLGWRLCYGPLAYGMEREVRTHILSHLRAGRITEGADEGGLCDLYEDARPDGRIGYAMYETFLDQAGRYLDYTDDREVAEALYPALAGCIARAERRLKPGAEMLFENSLNTWTSDSHWTVEGQCTQSTALTYGMLRLAARLAPDEATRREYSARADRVKKDLFAILWQRRKGVFAYCRDLRGNRLLHGEPELADIYHTAEQGLTDPEQTYEMLDWAEANLRQSVTENGGHLFWTANWHPNAGDGYTHSTYELALGENLNLALVYQRIGLAEQGYEIFRSVFDAMYGVPDEGIPDHDQDSYIARGLPPIPTEMLGGIPCQVHENGRSRRQLEFGDSIGMFGRALCEGIFGIRPRRGEGVLELSPCLPDGMREARIASAQARVDYRRGENFWRVQVSVRGAPCALRLRLPIPPAALLSVTGGEAHTEPGFLGQFICISCPEETDFAVEARFAPVAAPVSSARRRLLPGERMEHTVPGEEILALRDPQGLFSDAKCAGGRLSATVSGAAGSGVFFLTVRRGGAEYIRPVPVEISGEPAPIFPHPVAFAAPRRYLCVPMEGLFNAVSPREVLERTARSIRAPAPERNQVNYYYLREHLTGRTRLFPGVEIEDTRWRSLVGADGIARTGEGIPFRSAREGAIYAAVSVSGEDFPDRVTVPVERAGRAVYLLLSGITFPMQSYVENLRVALTYADGAREEHPLIPPYNLCDGWSNCWGRYHDSPGCGFENLRGGSGAFSSAGLALDRAIPTDTEAEIVGFPLRAAALREVEVRAIANDVVFCLMGVTVLE